MVPLWLTCPFGLRRGQLPSTRVPAPLLAFAVAVAYPGTNSTHPGCGRVNTFRGR